MPRSPYLVPLSLAAAAVTLLAVLATIGRLRNAPSAGVRTTPAAAIERADSVLAGLEERSALAPRSRVALSPDEVRFLREELSAARSAAGAAAGDAPAEGGWSTRLVIKLIFSGVLGLAALFVVLSRRYDDETKKWAFSVLSLISGVWIGSATG
jgi:hypothetical protein